MHAVEGKCNEALNYVCLCKYNQQIIIFLHQFDFNLRAAVREVDCYCTELLKVDWSDGLDAYYMFFVRWVQTVITSIDALQICIEHL